MDRSWPQGKKGCASRSHDWTSWRMHHPAGYSYLSGGHWCSVQKLQPLRGWTLDGTAFSMMWHPYMCQHLPFFNTKISFPHGHRFEWRSISVTNAFSSWSAHSTEDLNSETSRICRSRADRDSRAAAWDSLAFKASDLAISRHRCKTIGSSFCTPASEVAGLSNTCDLFEARPHMKTSSVTPRCKNRNTLSQKSPVSSGAGSSGFELPAVKSSTNQETSSSCDSGRQSPCGLARHGSGRRHTQASRGSEQS